METGAAFSECRTYRYALWRTWDKAQPRAMFVGLNPSTADETKNDPTIRRCISFAKDWGYGGVIVVNLFGFRATKPEDLFAAKRPVGPENDAWILRFAEEAAVVVAAWGNDGKKMGRSSAVRQLVPGMMCLKVNKTGEPAHPLYQPKTAKPVPFL